MKAKQYLPLLLLFFISLVPLLNLFHPGLPMTHDGQDQAARIANFYQSLSEGNLIPRWAANLNWGYGHPILMFLYPLPSYVTSVFLFLGIPIVESVKITFALSFVLSGIFMYLWIKEVWGKEAGFAAGLIYMFAPYRFVDLYVRGAIGECWAFVWPPLILLTILKFRKTTKTIYLFLTSFGIAALIFSHNALSLMFLPVIIGYMTYTIYKTDKRIFSFFFGLTLSAFFWLPAVFEAKYTLREIVTKNNISGFEPLTKLFWSPWNYGGTGVFSAQLGILQWLAIFLSPFLIWQFWQKKDKIWHWLLFLLLVFGGAIFLILPVSKSLYLILPFLSKFQFAWRFLSLAIFPPAVFAGSLIYLLPKKFKLFAVCCLLFAVLFLNKDFWSAKAFLDKPESFYTGIYHGTTDTGESAPRWSVRFMEKEGKAHLEAIDGGAEIEEKERKTTQHVYNINVLSEKARLRENTLYFPGWQVLIDSKPVGIEFQDPVNRGLMTFFIPQGNHQIAVVFGETKLRLLADLISGISFFGCLGYLGIRRFKK